MSSTTKVGIVFDDGFVKSSIATAEIFESFSLQAVFAVLAEPQGFVKSGGVGDWALWNEMVARGHIVHPHGYTHLRLTDVSPEQAVGEVRRCLDTFAEKLAGFRAQEAVYCCTYNLGTPDVIQWLVRRVRAVRIGGTPFLSDKVMHGPVWTSAAFGPGDPFDDFMTCLDEAVQLKPAGLLYCLHGFDGEHWGAIARDNLKRVLERIVAEPGMEYWPLTTVFQAEKP